ncbi:MATE family efflux transporter [Marinilabiliaceae bacterium JC017]|nr:MATE family efflux transporter [Marinilabiliaceae bacterium JC017]
MNKNILRLALPNIFTNLTVPLLGMVDLHLMGYQNSEVFMGAVALGGVIFNFVYWGFAFLRMSLSGVAAQAFGRKDDHEMAMVLFRGLLLAIVGALLLLLTQNGIEMLSLSILEGTEDVKELAREYFYVRIWAAPAAISLMVFYGWFLGMQKAIYPMLISVLVNLVNIGCSFLFVKHYGMQVKGVALGSVIGQYFGLLLAVILFLRKYSFIIKEFVFKHVINATGLKAFLHVGGDIFIRTFCIIVVFTFFTSRSAGIGNVVLAANSALLQFLFLFSYFLDGFAYAAEALVGKYYGAKDTFKLRRVSRLLMMWGLGFAICFCVIYWVSGRSLLTIFTNMENVIDEAENYLPWLIAMPLMSFASYIYDGIYIGATASKLMRNTMLLSTITFFVIFYSLKSSMGNHALWFAMIAFMFARGVFQAAFIRKGVFAKLS